MPIEIILFLLVSFAFGCIVGWCLGSGSREFKENEAIAATRKRLRDEFKEFIDQQIRTETKLQLAMMEQHHKNMTALSKITEATNV